MKRIVGFKNIVATAVAVSFFVGGANGATAETLNSVVKSSLVHNPDVLFAKNKLQAALQESNAASGVWLPQVNFEAAAGQYSINNPGTKGADYSYAGNRATIQISENLFNGFATINDVRRLNYIQQSAYYDYVAALDQATLETLVAYIDVLRYRKLVELAQNNVKTHRAIFKRIEEKVRSGVGRGVDLEIAQGRLALAESNTMTDLGNLNTVNTKYARLTGFNPAADLEEVEALTKATDDMAMPNFISEAIKRNPRFLSSVAMLRAYRADNEVRKAAMYPSLDIRGFRTNQNRPDGAIGTYQSTGVELVLNYNLFKGGSDLARVKQYAAKYESAINLRDKQCADIWQNGKISMDNILRLKSQMKSLDQHALSIAKARQAYQQQFDIGQRTLLDLLDIENEYFQSSRAVQIAEGELKIAQAAVLVLGNQLQAEIGVSGESAPPPENGKDAQSDDETQRCLVKMAPAIDYAGAIHSEEEAHRKVKK